MSTWRVAGTSIAVACLLSAGCGISGGDNAAVSSTTAVTTASDAGSTTSGPTTTTAPPAAAPPITTPPITAAPAATPTTATPTTATPGPAYGSSCQLGSHPDCIDPDGDGAGTYLRGGAACMDEMAPTLGPGICTDLDGDGRAGYPDAG